MSALPAIHAVIDERSLPLHDLSDSELYDRMAAGEERAFSVLRNRHFNMVRRAATLVLGDAHEGEDVAQEVMLVVWKRRGGWEKGLARFSTWLHRIAVNKAIDFRRRARCVPQADETLAAALDGAPERPVASEQEDNAHRTQLHTALKGLLQRLPAAQRDALTLFYFEEAEVDAIAGRMAVTEQAVRSLLKRGKATLRAYLHMSDPSLGEAGPQAGAGCPEDRVLACHAARSLVRA